VTLIRHFDFSGNSLILNVAKNLIAREKRPDKLIGIPLGSEILRFTQDDSLYEGF